MNEIMNAAQPHFVDMAKLTWILKKRVASHTARFESEARNGRIDLIAPETFKHPKIYFEVGAGSGWMMHGIAKRHPDAFCIAVERDRMRGNQLTKRMEKAKLPNFLGIRGNIIPVVIHSVPDAVIDRWYLMYPCPFTKSPQRKNRWYLHPAMPHFLRGLKSGGLMIWASDQKFYIDEAAAICEKVYGLEVLYHGPVMPNAWNHLEEFPAGRTKFEHHFLSAGQPCYELVVKKP